MISPTYAQNITVSGIVRDSTTDEPIPFASLQLKGTMIGSNTDANGVYSISVPQEAILIFSSIGYKSLEINVKGKAKHDVALLPDTEKLQETIVVAFGTATKESFTGSAAVVKSSDISKVQSSDATRALEGVVAGVQMTTSSGSLGSSPSIRIRGISSISAGNAPLYVVDGIPYSGDMNNLNSNDIESITVLKDAASNSLYGARGANGVIMITTKKGKVGEARVSVDAKWGINSKALKRYNYITNPAEYYETYYKGLHDYFILNGYTDELAYQMAASSIAESPADRGLGYNIYTIPEGEYLIGRDEKLNPNATLGRVAYYVDPSTNMEQAYLLYPDNWRNEIYKKSLRQEYNINVSGSTGKATTYSSFGYLKNEALVDKSDMERYTARLKSDYQAKSWLRVGGNMSYANTRLKNGNTDEGDSGSTGNLFAFAQSIAPIYPLYIRDGKGNIMIDKYGLKRYDMGNADNAGCSRPISSNANPVLGNLLNVNQQDQNAFTATGYAEIKILKDLKFTFNLGAGVTENRITNVRNGYYGQFVAEGGLVQKYHTRSKYINVQQLLNYNKTFKTYHHLTVLLGHESYKLKNAMLGAGKKKMFSLNNHELGGAVIDAQSAASNASKYNTEGFFTRVQYDYDNKIFGSLSYRRDGSSKFHPDHRWGNFWSVGASWLIDKEQWFNVPWVNMLKLKGSIGSQGNDGIGSYLYEDKYDVSNNEGEISLAFTSKGNKKITWETNTNINLGFDFEIFNNITGSLEYFRRNTTDMLFFFTAPPSIGYPGYYDNIGDMKNEGVEFSLNAGIIEIKDFGWDVNFNITHYKNEVTMLPADKKTVTIEGHSGYKSGNKFIAEGLPLNTFSIPKFAGVNRETGESLFYARELDAEDNPTGKIVTTSQYDQATDFLCGDPTPDFYGGLGTSLHFKGFDFSVQCTYSVGGKIYDSGYSQLMGSPTGGNVGHNIHKDIYKAWRPNNKDSNIPRFIYGDEYTNAVSDRFLKDASYFNVQNAQFGYTFPKKIVNKIKLQSLRLYLTCDNIYYLSKRRGLDPRFSFSGSTNASVNSPVRTISGGISLTF